MKTAKGVGRDKDLAKVGAALRRAASQARKIAEQTSTPIVILEEGRLIRKKVAKQRIQ
jgi:2-keto-4-pentenoate hydratase